MIDKILNPFVQQFIKDHQFDDPFQLSLEARKYPQIPINLVADQIRSRQKAAKKIPLWIDTEKIVWPPPVSLEQSSSQWTAIFKSELLQGDILADLTGGAGTDTYFLSGKFNKTFYVESDPWLCSLAKHNFPLLTSKIIDVRCEHAWHFIAGLDQSIDVIYIDPSRRKAGNKRVFLLEDMQPNVLLLLPQLLKKAKIIMIKLSPLIDIDYLFKNIAHLQKVYVLAVNNECKEVLCLITLESSSEALVEAVNLKTSGTRSVFGFDLSIEKQLGTLIDLPRQYIYEPNAAVIKSGAFKSVPKKFGLAKLHTNSHLYTSDKKVADFPGAIFQLKNIIKPQRKALRKLLPSGQANLAIRNFPATVAELKKRLQIADGGDDHIFATTLKDEQKVLLITERLRD